MIVALALALILLAAFGLNRMCTDWRRIDPSDAENDSTNWEHLPEDWQ